MTDQLSSSIEKLKMVSPQLNRATDEAGGVVRRVEEFLNSGCSLGLTSYVTVRQEVAGTPPATESDRSDGPAFSYQNWLRLGYARIEGKFRVVVSESLEEFSGTKWLRRVSESLTAWASCPRDLKLVTFPRLPELLEQLAREVDRAVESTSDAIATAKRVLAALGEGGPAPEISIGEPTQRPRKPSPKSSGQSMPNQIRVMYRDLGGGD